MKPKRIANRDMGEYVSARKPFVNNNDSAYARREGNLYVAYSWGNHFPMYIYDSIANMWFGNSDKYSRSTSKHQTYARPSSDDITWSDTDYLKSILLMGGYVQEAAARVQGEPT